RPAEDRRARSRYRTATRRRPHRQYPGVAGRCHMTSAESRLDEELTATGGGAPAWRRLSPPKPLVPPVQELAGALLPIAGIFVAGSTSGHDWWGLASLGIVIAAGMLRWLTTTYRITPDYVQVRRGLLRRRELSVPRDRVRTVDVTAHAIHRIVGLARGPGGPGRAGRKGGGGGAGGAEPGRGGRAAGGAAAPPATAGDAGRDSASSANSHHRPAGGRACPAPARLGAVRAV